MVATESLESKRLHVADGHADAVFVRGLCVNGAYNTREKCHEHDENSVFFHNN
jgi:hypothetical protein